MNCQNASTKCDEWQKKYQDPSTKCDKWQMNYASKLINRIANKLVKGIFAKQILLQFHVINFWN